VAATLFISDLHLHESRPEAIDCFADFLGRASARQARLYILGDLFESWIGDDDPDPAYRRVITGLAGFVAAGGRLAVMRGNRDFLLGARFAGETGATLLPDEQVELLDGERVLLMHGDLLCTDDVAYQAFRRRIRNPSVERALLMLPVAARRAIARALRRGSQRAQASAPETIMDVNEETVRAYMKKHAVRTLIHGHTHRPAVHRLELDAAPAQRIVLGDWYTHGSTLEWNSARNEIQTLAFAPRPETLGRHASSSATD
jgi:UDP-2,3-diacylglucosamine hydrolase